MAYYGSSTINLTDLKTEDNFVLSLSTYRTIAGLLIVAVVFGSLGNVLVVVTILKSKRFRVPVYALLLQVASLDALFQTFVVPINIYSFFNTSWTPSTTLCTIIVCVTHMLLCTSGLLLMIVSVYRCVLVRYNDLYMKIKSPKVVCALCVFVWGETVIIFCVLWKNVSFSREYMTCAFENNSRQLYLLVFLYLPMSLIPFGIYIRIVVFIKNARRRVLPQGRTSSGDQSRSHALTKMTALISLNHLVTDVLPGIFVTVIRDDIKMRSNLVVIAVLLLRLTAVLDVIIYIFNNRAFRSMFMAIFTSLRLLVAPRVTQPQLDVANRSRF